jgi:DNA mismatch repair ATPase MutS
LDIGYVISVWIMSIADVARALQARIDAIEEIISEKTYHVEKLRGLLINIPDLVKGLTRIQYGKVRSSSSAIILADRDQGPTHGGRHHPHQPPKNRRRIQKYYRRTIQIGATE